MYSTPPFVHGSGRLACSQLRNSSRNACSTGVRFKSIEQYLRDIPDDHAAAACVDAVFHHRHAERATDRQHAGARLQRLAGALLVDALVRRLLDEAHAATAAAAEALIAIARHLDRIAEQSPRRVVHGV